MSIISRFKFLLTGNPNLDIKSVFDRKSVSGLIRDVNETYTLSVKKKIQPNLEMVNNLEIRND